MLGTNVLPSSYTLKTSTTICSLWSNYGSISRLTVSNDNNNQNATATTTPTTTLILKSILPPSTTTTADESHLRKLISYRVERYFYTHLSPLLSRFPATKVADLISINDSAGELLLEDLSVSYPVSCYGSTDTTATAAVIKWLAGFHGIYWASEVSSSPSSSETLKIGTSISTPLSVSSPNTTNGIWQRGGYWYLATRSDEFSALLDSGEYGWLLPWVEDVDLRIENEKKEWKTLVHGDVKGANILLSSNSRTTTGEEIKAALYDFQYCGIATPAVDLVYFLGTTVDRKLTRDLEGLLRSYYDELSEAYTNSHEGKRLHEETGYTYEVLKEQWDVAVVDWMRFMAGGGGWGNWRWIEQCAKEAVKRWETERRRPSKKA
ncbi:hypothetical protein ABW20_dc0103817 [Dactylellina cionopaga]|nr:hypothetical protein ABW20_dc0103817 [Dactylellina cionopaga]